MLLDKLTVLVPFEWLIFCSYSYATFFLLRTHSDDWRKIVVINSPCIYLALYILRSASAFEITEK